MAKKKLIKIGAGNLFQNSPKNTMSTSTCVGFQFLNGKNLKLCSEYDKTADGILIVNFFDDFVIPEYIFINGDNYKVTEIGSWSFPKTMKSIFIPASICKIENYAFWFTLHSSLKEIHVAKDNKFYDNRENCNAIIETASNTLLKGCKTTKIPTSVKRLGISSFATTKEMESFCIPDNIELIEEYAFCNCDSLKNIVIPETIKKIEYSAFAFCGLTSVTINNKKAKIHKTAFDYNILINGKPLNYWLRPTGKYLNLQKK